MGELGDTSWVYIPGWVLTNDITGRGNPALLPAFSIDTRVVWSDNRVATIDDIPWAGREYQTWDLNSHRKSILTCHAELHLLEFHRRFFEYLQYFQLRPDSPLTPLQLEIFSNGDIDKTISDKLITEVFLMYSQQTGKPESERYLRTLTGESKFAIIYKCDAKRTL
jgi:hypothetical protein